MRRLKKGQRITHIRTGKTGIYLKKHFPKLSIDLWVVKFDGDDFETTIAPTLLVEGQFNHE